MGGGSSAYAMQLKSEAEARARLRKPRPEKYVPVRDRATLFAREGQEHHLVPPQDDIKVKKKKVKVPDPRNSRPLLQMPGYVDAKVAAQRRMVEEEVKRKKLEKEEAMQGRLISMGIKKDVIDHIDQEVQARRRKRRKEAHKCRIRKTTDEAVAMMTYSAWPFEKQWLMLDRLQYQRKWQVQKKQAEERKAREERTYLYASEGSAGEPTKAPALSVQVERNRIMMEALTSHAELMERFSPRYKQNQGKLEASQGSDDEKVASQETTSEVVHEHYGHHLPKWFNTLGIENEQTMAVARALSKTSLFAQETSDQTMRSLSKSESMPSPISSSLSPLSPLSQSSPSSKRLSSKAESIASTAASLGDLHGTHDLVKQGRPDGDGSKQFFLGNVS